jgi:hypothetical protein
VSDFPTEISEVLKECLLKKIAFNYLNGSLNAMQKRFEFFLRIGKKIKKLKYENQPGVALFFGSS